MAKPARAVLPPWCAAAAVLVALLPLAVGDPNTSPPAGIPLLARFAQVENGFEDTGSLSFFWTVENAGAANETIHAALFFDAANILNMWIGFGWGSSMLNSDSMIVWANPNTKTPTVIEGIPSGWYSPPVASDDKILRFQGMTQQIVGNAMVVEFRRPTRPSTGSLHAQIDINAPQRHIWAFNPNPNPASESGWKDHHGPHRGGYKITYATGEDENTDPDSIIAKRIHGMAMAITWTFVFPSSIYYTRYFRSVSGWLLVHMALQSIGAGVGVIGFAIYIITTLGNNFGGSVNTSLIFRPHSILGLCITVGTLVQGVFGIFNRLSLSSESMNVDRSRFGIVRFVHNWLGRLLVVAAFAQVGLGVQTLYPLSETKFRGAGAWIAYVIVVSFWVLLFMGTDVYYQYRLANVTQKLVVGKDGKKKIVSGLGKASGGGSYAAVPGAQMSAQDQLNEASLRARPDLTPFTWGDIDENTRSGNLLVVANGRYVYSINSWIHSHPGGQIILHSVAGTDITNDYFNEAGFDAEAFVPQPRTAAQTHGRALPPARSTDAASAAASSVGGNSSITLTVQERAAPSVDKQLNTFANMAAMDEAEWQTVVRARRTHVHTRLAIAKLSTLLVGELVAADKRRSLRPAAGAGDPSGFGAGDDIPHEPLEYRRYALVSSVCETPTGTLTPVFRLKFCILFPHDTRAGEPEQFEPGQCIEIQARVGGKYVSRYFTPINGNLGGFEVLVKLAPKGGLTPFLVKQKPGDRQFKIRGPFGAPFVRPDVALVPTSPNWCYERIVAICGGSGLAPALQLIQMLLLPTFVPLSVWQAYTATHPDEITLNEGDWVMAREHYFDGWVSGVNLTTQQEGLFPLTVTTPRTGPRTRISIINAAHSHFDVFGSRILSGALLAYPTQIHVVHCLPRGAPMGVDPAEIAAVAPGTVVQSRVTTAVIDAALQVTKWQPGRGDGLQHVLVCGPRSFESAMYDILTDSLSVDHSQITMLPDDSYA
ncbi:hypothetical protein HK105_204291 [Polyrhizophydium stewartii]|uniref:Uncharacterized protein n=1 Tax=Polyrhizophydium stewartii TaxID=2732419 RepID=A0ABR4N9K4_9FUNG